jgi:tripartite-type tricarboxylate transporter receptor subunit TctC
MFAVLPEQVKAGQGRGLGVRSPDRMRRKTRPSVESEGFEIFLTAN